MKIFTPGLFLVVFTLFSNSLIAQESTKPQGSTDSGTIDSQFDWLYESSNNYQEYKVVKLRSLDRLRSNMLDSTRAMRKEVGDLKLIISNQNDSIRSLNQILLQTETEKQEAIAAKDNFMFIGMNIHKSVYTSFMWLLVAGLAGALGFFSFQYFRSFKKIQKAQKDLEEVQEEFDQHRKNTLERERKLKRELIDAQMGQQ